MKTTTGKIAKAVFVFMLVSVLVKPGVNSFPCALTVLAQTDEIPTFTDVSKTDWYYEDLKYILRDERKILSGYPDGTFRPNETLTVDMFIKLIVTIMGYNLPNGEDYWASTYIKKAIDEGLIIPWQDSHLTFGTKEEPYAGYKRPIRRGDMVLIAGRAMDKIITNPEYRDQVMVATLIKDYRDIYPGIRANVVRFYDLGILTGYTDGEFKPDNYLTRAEAVAVIRRIIDPSARRRPELPVAINPTPTPIPVSELKRPPRKDLGNGVVEVEGVRFDPAADVGNPSNGAMKILKAQEFLGVFLEHLKFYEHEGKVRVRGYIPELPDGYEWGIAIFCSVKEPTDLGLHETLLSNDRDSAPEVSLPPNGRTFDVSLYTNKENIIAIVMTCEIRYSSTSANGGYHWISFTEGRYSVKDRYGGFDGSYPFDARRFFEW